MVDGVMVSHGSSTYLKPSVMDTVTTHILACVEPPSGVHAYDCLPALRYPGRLLIIQSPHTISRIGMTRV